MSFSLGCKTLCFCKARTWAKGWLSTRKVYITCIYIYRYISIYIISCRFAIAQKAKNTQKGPPPLRLFLYGGASLGWETNRRIAKTNSHSKRNMRTLNDCWYTLACFQKVQSMMHFNENKQSYGHQNGKAIKQCFSLALVLFIMHNIYRTYLCQYECPSCKKLHNSCNGKTEAMTNTWAQTMLE